jgi:hypothetical protein
LKLLVLIAVVVVILIIPLPFAIKRSTLKSVSIEIIGESIIGGNYHKTAIIRNDSGKYDLTYKCTSRNSAKHCTCADVSKGITAEETSVLMKEIASLSDGGDSTKCCDYQ